MKFQQYLLEKVSHQDINAILNDKNIMIGAEFEIILDPDYRTGSAGGYGYDIDRLQSEYEAKHLGFESELKGIRDSVEQYIDYLKDQLDPVKADLIKVKKEIEKYRDVLDSWATTNPQEVQAKIDGLESKKEDLVTMLHKADKLMKGRPSKVNEFATNLQIYFDNNGHDEEYDDFLLPSEWIREEIAPEVGSVTSDFDDFYETMANAYGFDSEVQELLDSYIDSSYTTLDYQEARELWETLYDKGFYEPAYIHSSYENDDNTGISITDLEDSGIFDDAPFDANKAKFGVYHASKDYSKWRVERDESLSAGGVEIISPVMPLKEGLKTIEEMFKWIKTVAETDSSTGFHINLSYKGANLSKDLDVLKLMLFMDEEYVWKYFPERSFSSYVSSVKPETDRASREVASLFQNTFRGKVVNILQAFARSVKIKEQREFGVNVTHALQEGPGNRVEFRYMGGSDYHKKFARVKTTIAKYAFYLKLSLDPEYRKREYYLKLNRLYNRFIDQSRNNLEDKELELVKRLGKKGKVDRGKIEYEYGGVTYVIDINTDQILNKIRHKKGKK